MGPKNIHSSRHLAQVHCIPGPCKASDDTVPPNPQVSARRLEGLLASFYRKGRHPSQSLVYWGLTLTAVEQLPEPQVQMPPIQVRTRAGGLQLQEMTPSARPSPGSSAGTGAGLGFAWARNLGKTFGVWGMSGSLAWDKKQGTRALRRDTPPFWVFG